MGFRKRQRQAEHKSRVNVLEVVSNRRSVPLSAGAVALFKQTGQFILLMAARIA
jgi:hypothetical protein